MCSKLVFKDDEIRKSLGANLNCMRKCDQLCDWFIKSEGNKQKYPVHKVVLAGASVYFEEIFDGKGIEQIKGGESTTELNKTELEAEAESELETEAETDVKDLPKPTEDLPKTKNNSNCNKSSGESQCKACTTVNVDSEKLERLLDYIYTGVIELNCSELIDVWVAAKELQLEKLKAYCSKTIVESLNRETCWNMWLRYGCLDEYLDDKTSEYVLDNVQYILETESVSDLHISDIGRLVSKNKMACNIDARYLFLEKWVSKDFDGRRKQFECLLDYFNFAEFTEHFFREKVVSNEKFKQSNKFLRKIISSMDLSIDNNVPIVEKENVNSKPT